MAGKLGKKVDFITQGEATELDKGLVEKITDPFDDRFATVVITVLKCQQTGWPREAGNRHDHAVGRSPGVVPLSLKCAMMDAVCRGKT